MRRGSLCGRLFIVVASFAVAACGGGGGSTSPALPMVQSNAPASTPAPTPTPTSAATGTIATPGPALAYMSSSGLANTFVSAIAPSSQVGYVINISTTRVTSTSGASPALTPATLFVNVGTSVSAFGFGRAPQTVLPATEGPTGGRTVSSMRSADVPRPEGRAVPALEAGVVRAVQTAATTNQRFPQSLRRTQSLPTTVGATASIWVNVVAIGQTNSTYVAVPATLAAVSNHGYIWIDNTIAATLGAQQAVSIGATFDRAYVSDVTHFGTPEYTLASANATIVSPACDAAGNPTGANVPFFIPPPNGMHHVFVVNESALGAGTGGYFSSINHVTQSAANCLTGLPKSNEASMIYIGYDSANSLNFELQEDVVRGTSHEFQHLINFVNKVVLLPNAVSEDTWINEGLSMLAQDFAVNALYPSVPVDVDATLDGPVGDFFEHPSRYSLTGFTGIDPGATGFAYNCTGCYGLSYLFQRYLYDRFGGDAFTHAMESSTRAGFANLQAATGTSTTQTIADFAVAVINSGSGPGSSLDPRYSFTHFNPYGGYTDQFGRLLTLNGPAAFSVAPGAARSIASYVGSFNYVSIVPSAGQGAGVTVSDPAGIFNLQAALLQL